MQFLSFNKWVRVSLLSLLTVALFGVLMRYKIGFEFPHFNQKNLQYAHSHFAFAGWVSQSLMILMIYVIRTLLTEKRLAHYGQLFGFNLLVAYGMLISFIIQGYGLFSIIFSTVSLIVLLWFSCLFIYDLYNSKKLKEHVWFVAALFFNLLSSFGTVQLVILMVSKQIPQHTYLASVYWYLHFQYNGWFFFACMGILCHYLLTTCQVKISNRIFWLFALTCIPCYGLSVLWLKLPAWTYWIVIIATLMQLLAWIYFLAVIKKRQIVMLHNMQNPEIQLLIYALAAASIKFLLQTGAVIPALSNLAFGFRPIVIAYLHLVLLAFISVFILCFFYAFNLLERNSKSKAGIYLLITGIFLNELALAVQGIASFSYTLIPFINVLLFGISLLMLAGIILLLFSHKNRIIPVYDQHHK